MITIYGHNWTKRRDLIPNPNPLVSSIWDDLTGPVDEGTHYHWQHPTQDNGYLTSKYFAEYAAINPGVAEFGYFSFPETGQIIIEFDLQGLLVQPSMFLSMRIEREGGYFGADANVRNDFIFDDIGEISFFQGDNIPKKTKFDPIVLPNVARFATGNLKVNDIMAVDVTDIYNNAVNGAWPGLGFRIKPRLTNLTQGWSGPNGAFLMGQFQLIGVDNSTINPWLPLHAVELDGVLIT